MKAALIPDRSATRRTVLVISPHLDDAVLACGRLLASLSRACRVIVATVFAGKPKGHRALTEWDNAGGFKAGDDVVAARRDEDRRALRRLGAGHRWLPFADSQYGETPTVRRVAAALQRLIRRERPGLVLFPLGLFHSDHRLVRDAALYVRRRGEASRRRWLAFEDALYRRIPGLLTEGVASLRRSGLRPRRLQFVGSAWSGFRKSEAVRCYASQLRALATPGRLGHEDAFAVEGYWQVGASHAGRNRR